MISSIVYSLSIYSIMQLLALFLVIFIQTPNQPLLSGHTQDMFQLWTLYIKLKYLPELSFQQSPNILATSASCKQVSLASCRCKLQKPFDTSP